MQEAIYIVEIRDGFEVEKVIKNKMTFYNKKRPHSSKMRKTPNDVYWDKLKPRVAA